MSLTDQYLKLRSKLEENELAEYGIIANGATIIKFLDETLTKANIKIADYHYSLIREYDGLPVFRSKKIPDGVLGIIVVDMTDK